MSGGKSMKKSVIGSRRTVMNSLNRMAPRPRKGARFIKSRMNQPRINTDFHGSGNTDLGFLLSVFHPCSSVAQILGCLAVLILVGVLRGERNENILERGTYFVN